MTEVEHLSEALRIAEAVRDDARAVSQRYLDEKRWAVRQLNDLLARAHRDGGHYLDEHGYEKAIVDAHERIAAAYLVWDARQDRVDK